MKTLNEAIDLVLNSPNQISLLIEKNAVKPLPAPRTPKAKKKPPVVQEPEPVQQPEPIPEPEPVIAVETVADVQAEPCMFSNATL